MQSTGKRHPCRVIAQAETLHGVVAMTCDPRDEGSERAVEIANARLIARAPEMAEALRKCTRLLECIGWRAGSPIHGELESDISLVGNEARALLAKIDGEA